MKLTAAQIERLLERVRERISYQCCSIELSPIDVVDILTELLVARRVMEVAEELEGLIYRWRTTGLTPKLGLLTIADNMVRDALADYAALNEEKQP